MSFFTDIPGKPILDAFGNPVLDGGGAPTFTPSIPAPPALTPEAVRPTVADVALLEATRTIDHGGAELGTFNSDTRPTATEVASIIDNAVTTVLGHLPTNVDAYWWPAITRAIALRAAATVESSFYRESSLSDAGPAAEYAGRFAADLASLQGLIPKAAYLS